MSLPADAHRLPIGVFDSGLGGLTIVKAMQAVMPHEAIIYAGDTAHMPYGDKSPERVAEFSLAIARFLLEQPVKAIVIACNTASAAAAMQVRTLARDVPVYDVIGPAVQLALHDSPTKKIGVIATRTTIQSGIYTRQLIAHEPEVHVVARATPLLAPMIEEGWLHNRVSQDVIDAYLSDTGFATIDALILGCTHYPLIKDQIADSLLRQQAQPVAVVDSSVAVAEYVRNRLQALHVLCHDISLPQHRYFLSALSSHFRESAGLFLGKTVEFEQGTWAK